MTPDRWKRVEEIFVEAIEMSPGQRTSWIDQACAGDAELRAEVMSLLASDNEVSETFMEGAVQNVVVSFSNAPANTRVGPYELMKELGRGGMGTVYLARRADDQYQTEVAVKLVRPGMDTDFILARFRRERQILASLDHPNIAKLLDGGTTAEGLPYIVMEYIRGVRINAYASRQQLGVDGRVQLFLDVCSAVDHAHRHFVVHRDLKPGNILVDERGAPKLLDFGICKLLYGNPMAPEETMTQAGGMMTPDYASPEQVRGENVTVASDVYSLGAVLYELLSGRRPHQIEDFSPRNIERMICEEDVARPSLEARNPADARRLAGDLDVIILKALHRDPKRRYLSAEQFAEDLRRYLDHRPVQARPDSLGYRAGKFARRHRTEVIAAGLVIVTLAGGVIASLRQARIAEGHLQQVQQLANAFVFDVHDSIRDLPGATKARQLIVEKGVEHLDRLAQASGGDPEIVTQLAAAYKRLGDVEGAVLRSNRGQTAKAIECYSKALRLLDSLSPRQRTPGVERNRMELYRDIGDTSGYTKGLSASFPSYRTGIEIGEGLLKRDSSVETRLELASLFTVLARAQRLSDQLDDSLTNSRRAVALLEGVVRSKPDLADGRMALATALSAEGMTLARLIRSGESLAAFQKAVAHIEELVRQDPLNARRKRELMLAYSHVGDQGGATSASTLGTGPESRKAYARMARIARELLEADKEDVRALGDYGIAMMRVAAATPPEDSKLKLATYQEAMATLDKAVVRDPSNQVLGVNRCHIADQIGELLSASKDTAGAVKWWRTAAAIAEPLIDSRQSSPPKTLVIVYQKLGQHAAAAKRREEALGFVRKSIQMSEKVASTGQSPQLLGSRGLVPRSYASAGSIHAILGDNAEAVTWYEKSLEAWKPLVGTKGFRIVEQNDIRAAEAALAKLKGETR